MHNICGDSFGQRIMIARRKRGLSLTSVAEKMGVAHQILSEYEHDKKNPRLETLRRIALAIECPMSELTGEAPADSELPSADAQLGILCVRRGADWFEIHLVSGDSIKAQKGRISDIKISPKRESENNFASQYTSIHCDGHARLTGSKPNEQV